MFSFCNNNAIRYIMLRCSTAGSITHKEVVLSLIRAKCLPILLYATEACPLLSRNRSSFEFTFTRLFMKLFRTNSSAVVKCCQLAFNFLPVNSQLDIRAANFLQKFIASDNSLCSLFALTARRQLNELFLQFDNVATAYQFYNAIHYSINCLNDASSSEAPI